MSKGSVFSTQIHPLTNGIPSVEAVDTCLDAYAQRHYLYAFKRPTFYIDKTGSGVRKLIYGYLNT